MIYPLSTKGVADLIESLYSLPDDELYAEANSIKSDFRGWVERHFSLSDLQKAYLKLIPQNSVIYFGDQCWFCFINRLKITLDYPSPPQPTGLGKWTEGKSSTKLIVNDGGGSEASGELNFTMVYRAL
jgi:hypothetical protein